MNRIILCILLVPILALAATIQKASAEEGDKKNYVDPEEVTKIKEVKVKARLTRAKQQGDSLVYKASSFKVLDGSNAEDLLSKMPGVVVEGGTIEAQGEQVKKIMVDGKEFFEGDVNLAIRSIPSEMVETIELFDKKSDQAEFTGFDDGNEIKTINIVTKKEFREGVFGDLYGGYGTEDRYKANANVNIFNDDERISILGMSNNINQQNFSTEDLSGVLSSSQSKGGPRGGMGGGRPSGGGGGMKPGSGGGSSANDFMVSSLDGVTSSHGAGINYVNKIGDKLNVTGSYFFNYSDNLSNEDRIREYFEQQLEGLSYEEFSESETDNFNHRFNARMEYTFSPRTSLIFNPSLSLQQSDILYQGNGSALLEGGTYEEFTSSSDSESEAFKAGGDLMLRHRFSKIGRTISLNLGGTITNTNGESYANYLSSQLSGSALTAGAYDYDQYEITDSKNYSLRSSLVYTEMLSRSLMLMSSWRMNYTSSDSDIKLFDRNPSSDLYDMLNEGLSNEYQSNYLTNSLGLGVMLRKGNFSGNADLGVQFASLDGSQIYPTSEDLGKNYISFLPRAFARYAVDKNNSFMLRYRSFSLSPSISDLQSVVDNSNPLFLTTGNPDLDQQINHSLSLRYIRTTIQGTTFIAMLGSTLSQDYVGEESTLDSSGVQTTRPINVDGYYSLQAMLTYGFPIDLIRSNVNVSLSSNYANEPTIFNGVESVTNTLTLTPKVIVGSNISEKFDFTLSYSAGFNDASSSAENSLSSEYINHSAGAKFGWIAWKDFTLRSSLNYTYYSGLDDADDLDYFLLNASIGKRFGREKKAELRIEAVDLLDQITDFSREVGTNYYDYVTGNTLNPYVMLSFSYKL